MYSERGKGEEREGDEDGREGEEEEEEEEGEEEGLTSSPMMICRPTTTHKMKGGESNFLTKKKIQFHFVGIEPSIFQLTKYKH